MGKNTEKHKQSRIAIVDPEICKPSQCALECKRACPVNKIGKECIVVKRTDKIAFISETLCIGCSACVKKCPFNAITIINVPGDLSKNVSHRYGPNTFKLHRLPVPKPGNVLGLVGTNGIGKSTALKILAGDIKPNLGNFDNPPDWMRILQEYKGSELHGFFTKILGNEITPATKIQYIDQIPKILRDKFKKNLTVDEALFQFDQRNAKKNMIEKLKLQNILQRNLEDLSGGELQRVAIAMTALQKADIYFFDEPSSYLDVSQRLAVAAVIRELADPKTYIVVVEHDLAILDLICDFGCVLYGKSGAYGVITAPFSIKQAINIFLDGYIPSENMRFRPDALSFNISQQVTEQTSREQFSYPGMKKSHFKDNKPVFSIDISPGTFSKAEIVVFLGENGMGKTTFVGLVAGLLKSDDGTAFPPMSISLKPQKIQPKFKGTVKELFMSKIRAKFLDSFFINEVIKPLNIEYLYDQPLVNMSGGELQRIAIVLCLGKDADLYLVDEPSAFLDSDQRIAVCKVIKRYMYNFSRTAFVVEHDLIMATYLADKIVVFEGSPGVNSSASCPREIETSMNVFLKHLNITFRRDQENLRPRVNKLDSAKDREQKEKGAYFFN